MSRIPRRSKKASRSISSLVVASLVASSMACSLFVDMDGLQDGAGDAAALSDVIVPNEASAPVDAAADTSQPESDSGADANLSAGPIAFVQTTDFDPPDAGSGDMTFGSPVAPGDTILVGITFDGTASSVSVTDDKSDVFHLDVGPIGETQGTAGFLFSAIGVPGNERVVHVIIGGGAPLYTELYAMDYSGIKMFDVGVGAYSSTSGAVSSGFITTTIPNEMLLGFAVDDSVTPGDSFTARNTSNSDLVEDRIVSVVGPYAATATMSGSGMILVGAYR